MYVFASGRRTFKVYYFGAGKKVLKKGSWGRKAVIPSVKTSIYWVGPAIDFTYNKKKELLMSYDTFWVPLIGLVLNGLPLNAALEMALVCQNI